MPLQCSFRGCSRNEVATGCGEGQAAGWKRCCSEQDVMSQLLQTSVAPLSGQTSLEESLIGLKKGEEDGCCLVFWVS